MPTAGTASGSHYGTSGSWSAHGAYGGTAYGGHYYGGNLPGLPSAHDRERLRIRVLQLRRLARGRRRRGGYGGRVATGAAIASANTAAATSSAYSAGVAAGSASTVAATAGAYNAGVAAGAAGATYPVGSIQATLPAGCATAQR